ncbi:MAG: exopolysaccharide biosynthesis polyprenyl glycosylphosphotransferase [Acidimicrobiales bacterium]|jgi:exopolysaccharide biosynthesis polyprenyl glycosylphosphotransferase
MHWRRAFWSAQILVDGVTAAAIWTLVLVVEIGPTNVGRVATRSWMLVALATVATLVLLWRRLLYTGFLSPARSEEGLAVLTATGLATSIVAIASNLLDWPVGAWELVLGGSLFYVVRSLVRGTLRELTGRERILHDDLDVIIVGVGEDALELYELMIDHPESGLRPLGVVGDAEVAERFGLTPLLLGTTDRVVDVLRRNNADAALITPTGFRGPAFRRLSRTIQRSGLPVMLSNGVSRQPEGGFSVRALSHEPITVLTPARTGRRFGLAAKRLMDVVASLVLIVVASPLLVLVAAVIRLESKGPVLYRSTRVGFGGEKFEMLKFRTMIDGADQQHASLAAKNERTGPIFKISSDPRVTRFGKLMRDTSIDEIPQLINVIRGQMSLVGPRPALAAETEAFDAELQNRMRMKPGITGLWQVEARENPSFSAYRRLDLHYIENWSSVYDLGIMIATAERVLISLALIPLRPFVQRGSDRIRSRASDVIDLRDIVQVVIDDVDAPIPGIRRAATEV